ncbi:MAG: peptidyl-prolyl cis-trans isomerase [Burkholderiales bacterium]|nr:peptidyl-prolyl cis-trans isomerase [Burkholderiales bacterium]
MSVPVGAQRSLVRRLVREPLLHFLLAGFTLFVAYSALNPQAGDRFRSDRIQLTEVDLRQMALVWAAKWRRPPTTEEIRSLIEDRVREEVLYRESLALGLDQGDTIVRRRLAQKMEFLAEDASAIRDADAAELKAWFEANRERFAAPGRVTFRHLYFSPDRHGDRTREAAALALQKLAREPAGSASAANAGDRFMYSDYYVEQVPDQVGSVFGERFAQALFRVEPGAWRGPIESGLGWHLVFIESATPRRVPAFEEIVPEVRAAWIEEQRAAAKRSMYALMRARYEVVLPTTSALGALTSESKLTAAGGR